ncbi:MAG: Pleiotropic regulatory protein [Flavobacteriales bacterium BRH_c54]|nr:MAG: Pleiotropic regulatory protein [Flavobacteriales bacterium BRH_c54]
MAIHNIQMVDLHKQYLAIKNEVDAAIAGVIESTQFINGDEVKAFQKELEDYLGVKHVIPCANGTDALQIALMALGLQPGDEVITSDFTFAATVEVVGLLKLKIVLVDVDPNTYCIDTDKLKKAITSKTKAIIPVHLFGQCANMEAIMQIANEHQIAVVEDVAQAIGASYTFNNGITKKAGTIGKLGTTSFFPSKNLGCYGDGGALFTNDDNLAEIVRSIVNHGMKVRYYYDRIGVNSRLDTIQAAILRVKLRHLDEYVAARNKAAAYYDEAFKNHPNIKTPVRDEKSTHVFHQYTLVGCSVDNFELQKRLTEKGVPCMIYYPVPLHTQEAYRTLEMKDEDFEITNGLCKSVFSLPMHTELEEDELAFITKTVKEIIEDIKQ